MSFDFVIPDIENKSSAKDMILSILINDWPLTLKEMFNHIKKEFKYSGSYQSIFKAVNELIRKKVLIKKGMKYEINISWIKNLQSFTDIVETNYYAEKRLPRKEKTKKGEDLVILNFSNIFDLEKYLYYFVKNELKKLKDEEVFYEMNSLWKDLFYYRAEYNYYKKLSRLGHKFYFLIGRNSLIEKSSKDFYHKLGVKVRKNGRNSVTDLIVFGDYYIEIFIPEEIKERIENLLEKKNSFELLKVLDEDIDVKIIMHKDKSLAEGVRNKLKKMF